MPKNEKGLKLISRKEYLQRALEEENLKDAVNVAKGALRKFRGK